MRLIINFFKFPNSCSFLLEKLISLVRLLHAYDVYYRSYDRSYDRSNGKEFHTIPLFTTTSLLIVRVFYSFTDHFVRLDRNSLIERNI